MLAGALGEAGWTSVEANNQNEEKNHTFSHTYFMFEGGERGGPMATYLVSADARENFDLWTNTAVRRAVRTGGQVTGVELECLSNGGLSGSVGLNPGGGVIFSAGAFGSAKLLFRSKLYGSETGWVGTDATQAVSARRTSSRLSPAAPRTARPSSPRRSGSTCPSAAI